MFMFVFLIYICLVFFSKPSLYSFLRNFVFLFFFNFSLFPLKLCLLFPPLSCSALMVNPFMVYDCLHCRMYSAKLSIVWPGGMFSCSSWLAWMCGLFFDRQTRKLTTLGTSMLGAQSRSRMAFSSTAKVDRIMECVKCTALGYLKASGIGINNHFQKINQFSYILLGKPVYIGFLSANYFRLKSIWTLWE